MGVTNCLLFSRTPSKQDEEYAATFNCQQKGGERITLTGHNFGDAGAFVYIGGQLCADPVHEEPGMTFLCVCEIV